MIGPREYQRERLGELLVRAALISQDQLDDALAEQATGSGKLGEVLVRQLAASEEQIARTLAEQKELEYVNLAGRPLDRSAVCLIPERVARLKQVIPIGFEDGCIVLAMGDPLDVQTIDDVGVRSGMPVKPVVATPTQIRYAIEKYVSSADVVAEVVDSATAVVATQSDGELAANEDVPIVRLVNQLIREAVIERASDIHVEPTERGVTVRYRVDGLLHDVMQLPPSVRAGITSRIKIMSEMDIAERRMPQDGRIQMNVEGETLDMRVATLPTPLGEAVTIRLLNEGIELHTLEALGMDGSQMRLMSRFLSRPYGAILLAGPTGSGKTTTLYASLKRLNDAHRKIITVEDPIEYRMVGLTQVAVNNRIGLSFARILRSILRSDPDVVMIGEMRDAETAEIGVRAALTGHLVLSSIHTNDAPSALTRLMDMGVEPYITSSALLGVVAQRLARRLCPECKQKVRIPVEVLVEAGFTEEEAASLEPYGPKGCPHCFDTGYRGRLGLFEIMSLDEELGRLFLAQAPMQAIRAAAIERGMQPLLQDALRKVAAGHTSLEEVIRVVI